MAHLMLFCALLLVRSGKATLDQSLGMVPLSGGAKRLAEDLSSQECPRLLRGFANTLNPSWL